LARANASADSRPIVPTPRDGGAEAFARANDPIADVITSRGFWDAPPAAATPAAKERMALASAESRPAPAPQPRTAAADTTSAAPAPSWPVRTADAADRIPRDAALSYAAPASTPPAAPVTRSLTPAAAIPRNAATVARQDPPVPPTSGTATIAALKPGTPLEDPWLRALVLAPNLRSYLTAMLLGDPPDPRELVALMEKPGIVVVMTFGEDPNLGMTTDRFTGSAVVFVNTVTIVKRTAALH
jgi:hypothetical protein